jgi:hypothetical protein
MSPTAVSALISLTALTVLIFSSSFTVPTARSSLYVHFDIQALIGIYVRCTRVIHFAKLKANIYSTTRSHREATQRPGTPVHFQSFLLLRLCDGDGDGDGDCDCDLIVMVMVMVMVMFIVKAMVMVISILLWDVDRLTGNIIVLALCEFYVCKLLWTGRVH